MSRPSQEEEEEASAAAAAEEESAAAAADEDDDDKPVVLLLSPLFPAFAAAINPRYRLLRPWESPLPLLSFLVLHAAEIRAILCSGPSPVPAEVVAALPNLELVVATSAGLNHIDLAACRRRGVRVANSGSVFSPDVADFAVGLAVAALRRIPAADRFVRSGSWPRKGDYPLASKVSGKRVGIVGLGSIGSEIAKRLEAFGCTITYNSRSKKPSVPYRYFPNVRALAVESDILILSCALTPQTHRIINRDVLLALGKDGVLINVGRGALVDEKELVECLVEGALGGAGLDVFESEPAVPEELFQMDNVVLSNHTSVLTPESVDGVLQVAVDNLDAFFSNKPLVTPVNLENIVDE